MKKDITGLFCFVHDFTKLYEEAIKQYSLDHCKKSRKPTRVPGLSESEIITIMLLFQQSSIRNFKHFYILYLKPLYSCDFPQLPSYERFVALKSRTLVMVTSLLQFILAHGDNINYIGLRLEKVRKWQSRYKGRGFLRVTEVNGDIRTYDKFA